MAKDLTEATLKAMGYKPEAPICKKCKYFSETESAYVDRCGIRSASTEDRT